MTCCGSTFAHSNASSVLGRSARLGKILVHFVYARTRPRQKHERFKRCECPSSHIAGSPGLQATPHTLNPLLHFAMPRPRFRRELCDCLDCVDPSRRVDPAEQAVRHSAALQDPPPKCLIVFADGTLLPASQEAGPPGTVTSLNRAHHPHLDGMARDGCSGLLAVQSPAAGAAPHLWFIH